MVAELLTRILPDEIHGPDVVTVPLTTLVPDAKLVTIEVAELVASNIKPEVGFVGDEKVNEQSALVTFSEGGTCAVDEEIGQGVEFIPKAAMPLDEVLLTECSCDLSRTPIDLELNTNPVFDGLIVLEALALLEPKTKVDVADKTPGFVDKARRND